MRTSFRLIAGGLALLAVMAAGAADASSARITPKDQWIEQQLESMGIQSKWIAGAHVDWRTGLPDDSTGTLPGRHTHCSQFVAAAAEKLGVYILRPPQHGDVLLANAQNEWLSSDGGSQGWRPIDGPAAAQAAANEGNLVVASYHNHHDNKPGHIAIVLPGDLDEQTLEQQGPNVINVSTVNSASISVRDAFAGHPHAWNDQEIMFFAHTIRAR